METEPHTDRMYLRWTKNERIQHWTLAISFAILVLTGFALKFPESWWAWPFLFGGGSIDVRGDLHRLAATAYLILSVYHVGYIAFTARGRMQFRSMMLRLQDFKDLKNQMAHSLGRNEGHPSYGHYTYWEKMEYWALVWGTVVMAGTGLALWFENLALKIMPLWILDLATVVHLYEAILASLAILVWHFYFVIFDPTVYPVNFSMFDGHLTQEQMEHEHPGELKAILNREAERESVIP